MGKGVIDFSKQKLPKIYERNGRDCYFDPIRQKLIYITPEETVRQQVISYLVSELHVPVHMIDVEVHLSHYGIKSNRRVDILINKYNESEDILEALCVIECKAPSIMLGESAENQMVDYCNALGCDYSMITNGYDILCYYYNDKTQMYDLIEEIPQYVDMVKGEYVELPKKKLFPRLQFEELFEKDNWKSYIGYALGNEITKDLAIPMTNFMECLLYPEHKLPKKKYKLFSVIEDIGVRFLSYGNASGASFQGPYRSFVIEYKGSTEIISIGMSTYVSDAKPDIVKTAIIVAIDNEETAHHSLQLVVENNIALLDNNVTFYHHGRIAIGNRGCGKLDELRQFVSEQYPEIIDGKRFNLGTLINDHLWNLDEPDVMKLVENFISYALIRDEYRKFVKNN